MITNRHNLPQPLIRALEKDPYSAGGSDLTVSSMHEPARVRLLKQKHGAEITSDVSERVNALLGTAFHKIMEMSAEDGATVEQRFHTNILGWDVSGAIDHYVEAEGHIRDWKVLSVWSVVIGDAIKEYTKKLNTYAYILRANNKPVRKLSIVVLFRDWQAREARSNPDYPQQQVIEYDLEVWDAAVTEKYVNQLVDYHQAAQACFDEDGGLPMCTDEEKWAKPTKYAVMKDGNKRATKVCETHGEAEEVANGIKGAHVETRPGEFTKCMFFCAVREHCEVGKALQTAAEEAY